jgi:hypothetical protein
MPRRRRECQHGRPSSSASASPSADCAARILGAIACRLGGLQRGDGGPRLFDGAQFAADALELTVDAAASSARK